MNWIKQNPLVVGLGGVVGLAVLAFLAFGVFGIHTAFIDDEIDEPNPFAAGEGASGRESDATSAELAADMNEAMEGKPAEDAVDEAMPVFIDDSVPTVTTLASGAFEGRSHPASGQANVITDGTQTFLRLEDDFATDNGPDLKVYLSAAPVGADSGEYDDNFISLGELKGNIGGQNYELDPSVDISQYQSVVIWCERFGVAFGAAPLNAA